MESSVRTLVAVKSQIKSTAASAAATMVQNTEALSENEDRGSR
jgi:hypothetical protein